MTHAVVAAIINLDMSHSLCADVRVIAFTLLRLTTWPWG